MIEIFGVSKKRTARVIDVKVDAGGKVQMTPSVDVSSGAGLSGDVGMKLPIR